MANLRIAFRNFADSMTLTATPAAAATYPVTYLQNDARGYVFRSSTVSDQIINGTTPTSGTAYAIACARLHRTNFVNSDTWRLQLFSDPAWTSSLYDSGAITGITTGVFSAWASNERFSDMWFTEVPSVQSFRLTLHTPANSDGYIEAMRLFLGPYVEAAYQPNYGGVHGWAGNSKQERRDGGSIGVDVKAKWRTLGFDMTLDTDAERAIWMEIGGHLMNEKTALISVYPGVGGVKERDFSLLGKFEESPVQKLSNRYDFGVKFNEI